MKIFVGTNTLTQVDQLAYSNHCQFWFRLGRNHPDIDFILMQPKRMSIDNMRNIAAKLAIENDCDYLLFIDDDVLVPLDTLTKLINTKADIAAGWTLIRGYPFKNMFFRFVNGDKSKLENYPNDFDRDNLVACDAVGFSCALIKVDLLKKVKKPYFVTGPYNTEDIYFCMKVRETIPNASIVVDPTVMTSHILGSELIDPLSVKLYKKYYEDLFPEVVGAKEPEIEKKTDENPNGFSYEDLLADTIWPSQD